MVSEKKEYGDPEVRLKSLLSNLRLEYKKGRDSLSKSTVFFINEFGVEIHLTKNRSEPRVLASGALAMFFCLEFTEEEITVFGEHLMLWLIGAGYMAYIREEKVGNRERVFQELIIGQGWGRKIINKRLETWKDVPSKVYMYKRLKTFSDEYTVIELISRYPGFFDFLS